MKKIRNICILSLAVAALTSCSSTVPMAVSNQAIGSRDGSSTTSYIFGIQTNKKFSLKEACDNGGIYKGISTVDLQRKSYFIYSTKTILVTGE